jgi:hypothetical protein
MTNEVLLTLVDKALEGRGFNADDVLFGSSICPDEINHEAGDIPDLLQRRFGPEFNLGGLAGLPFTGKTGFGAFAAHVPKDGNIFIVYAPHVGISRDGEIGCYHREGQSGASTACGACIGALSHVESTPLCMPCDEADFQMEFIKHVVKDNLVGIQAHGKGKQVGLVHEVYKVGRQMLLDMIDLSMLTGGSLCLLGGLQINMPPPMEDFFLPLDFTMLKEGQEPEDLVHFLDEGRLWDLNEQPEQVGSPRHSSPRPGSKDLSPILSSTQANLAGVPPLDDAATAEIVRQKDAEIAELKQALAKLEGRFEEREAMMGRIVGEMTQAWARQQVEQP